MLRETEVVCSRVTINQTKYHQISAGTDAVTQFQLGRSRHRRLVQLVGECLQIRCPQEATSPRLRTWTRSWKIGDSTSLPHFLMHRVNSAKSWHSRHSDEAKENFAEQDVRSRFFQCFSNLLIIVQCRLHSDRCRSQCPRGESRCGAWHEQASRTERDVVQRESCVRQVCRPKKDNPSSTLKGNVRRDRITTHSFSSLESGQKKKCACALCQQHKYSRHTFRMFNT